MAKTDEQILASLKTRQQAQSNAHALQRLMVQHYNFDIVVPVPELDRSERPMVANLIGAGVDQFGMRIASTMPGLWVPPLRRGSEVAEKRASRHRRAALGWMAKNRYRIRQRQRARWFVALTAAPVVVRPGRDGIPRWDERSPLLTYPCPTSSAADIVPDDCIFTVQQPLGWLRSEYPDVALPWPADTDPTFMVTIVEYHDAEESVLIATSSHPTDAYSELGSIRIRLGRTPNPVEMCPVVIPGRIGLDEPRGQFDDLPGMVQWRAKIASLQYHALVGGVFPRTWLVARQGEVPEVVVIANGRDGTVGEVKGGDLKEMPLNPSLLAAGTLVDRGERDERVTGLIPPDFGAESGSNIRTGVRGADILSSTIDFPIQEAQELFEESAQEELRIATRWAQRINGDVPRSFFVKGTRGLVEYTPTKDFATDDIFVSYAQAGADINQLTVAAGQRVGMQTMSRRRFMEIDPLIDDPDWEHDQSLVEQLEQAAVSSVLQKVVAGERDPGYVARLIKIIREDDREFADGVLSLEEEAAAQQAGAVPPEEATPGLLGPAAAPPPSVAPPERSIQNLNSLLFALTGAQEQAG